MRGERTLGEFPRRLDLGFLLGEALHDRRVREHIACAFRQRVMHLLDLPLRAGGAPHRDAHRDQEADEQPRHERGEPPVEHHGDRQHHQDRKERREMTAQEPEPEREQVARAGVHDAQ